MDRKTFLRTTVAGAAALVAAPGALVSCASPKEKKQPSVPLRLSFQEGVTPGETLAEKLDFMEKLGIVGFEPGGKGLAGRVPEIREALQGRDIKVSAIKPCRAATSKSRPSAPASTASSWPRTRP